MTGGHVLRALCALAVGGALSLPAALVAGTLTVAPDGADSNPGTPAAPLATLQVAVDRAAPDTVILVRGGTYRQRVRFTKSGASASAPLTLKAAPGETPILDGTGLPAGVMISAMNQSFLTVDGVTIQDNLGGGITLAGQASGLTIRQNTIRRQRFQPGTDGHAISVGSLCWPNLCHMDHVIIDGNTIDDVVTGVGDVFDEALTVSWSVDTFQITNNTLTKTAYIGIDMIGKSLGFTRSYLPWTIQPTGSPWPRNGLVAGNTVAYGGWLSSYPNTGIYMDGAAQVVIEHNTVHDFTRYGIVISAEDGDFQTQQIIVRRNTLWNNPVNIDCGGFSGRSTHIRCAHNTLATASISSLFNAQGSDVVWRNNLAVNASGKTHLTHYLGTSDAPSMDANLYWPDGMFQHQGTAHATFAAYRASTGQDRHSLLADPRLTPGALTLTADSPAIDAGLPLTVTRTAGSGTVLLVEDARWFSDGYGVTRGDVVQVGTQTARVRAVDYTTQTLTLDTALTWTAGLGVTYPYTGQAPDIGAMEMDAPPRLVLPAPTHLRLLAITP